MMTKKLFMQLYFLGIYLPIGICCCARAISSYFKLAPMWNVYVKRIVFIMLILWYDLDLYSELNMHNVEKLI